MDTLELQTLAEFAAWSPNPLPGEGCLLVRKALGLERHELAVELETTERQIAEIERARFTPMPPPLARKLRNLYLNPTS